jgi:hypothetical protein
LASTLADVDGHPAREVRPPRISWIGDSPPG